LHLFRLVLDVSPSRFGAEKGDILIFEAAAVSRSAASAFFFAPSRLGGQKFPEFLAKSTGFIARFLGRFAIGIWGALRGPTSAPLREICLLAAIANGK
jgi:hypothetical protein